MTHARFVRRYCRACGAALGYVTGLQAWCRLDCEMNAKLRDRRTLMNEKGIGSGREGMIRDLEALAKTADAHHALGLALDCRTVIARLRRQAFDQLPTGSANLFAALRARVALLTEGSP